MQTHCWILVVAFLWPFCLFWHHSTRLIITSMHTTTHTIVYCIWLLQLNICYSLSLWASSLFDIAFFFFFFKKWQLCTRFIPQQSCTQVFINFNNLEDPVIGSPIGRMTHNPSITSNFYGVASLKSLYFTINHCKCNPMFQMKVKSKLMNLIDSSPLSPSKINTMTVV